MRKTMTVGIAIPAAILVMAALAGCGNNNPPPTTTTVVAPAAPATTMTNPSSPNAPGTNNVNAGPGGATGAKAAVADAVNKAIHTNVQMTGSRITAVVDASGVATLTGTAQDKQQKALAEKTAKNTSGVVSIKDKIQIVPTGGAKQSSSSMPQKPTVINKTVVIHDNSNPPVTPVANGVPHPAASTDGGSTGMATTQ